MQLFWTFNHSGNLLTIAGFLAPLAQYFSATSTGRIWQALILLHLSSSCFFVKHTYLSTCYLIFTFTYLFEETINITLLFTRRIFLLQLLFPSTCSPSYEKSISISDWDAFTDTAWEVSKYGVFSGPYFPAFGLNTERYRVSLCIEPECGKIWTRRNCVFGHFLHSGLYRFIRRVAHISCFCI